MKLIKYILALCITISISSCSNNNSDVPFFELSKTNIAGTYNIKSLSTNAKASALVSNLSVPVSTATSLGETFQVNFSLNADGTYIVSGSYVLASTITPSGLTPIKETTIISLEDSGSYEIDTIDSTITFYSSKENFIKGTFKVLVFNETTFYLTQDIEEEVGQITTAIKTNISFTRN